MRLRSLLFVPGDRPERMEKACASGADGIIFDLEDSVAPERKPEARANVARLLNHNLRPVKFLVRINPIESVAAFDDLQAIAGCKPDGIVLPKTEGAASIRKAEEHLVKRDLRNIPLLPIATETPAAIFHLLEYQEVSAGLLALTWGAEDLPAAIGAAGARQSNGSFTPPYEVVRSLALFAAHAANVPAIETVYPAFRDDEGLAAYAARGAFDGFSGMMAIHPSQVPIINQAFTPSPEALDRARKVVEAFRGGAGAVSFEGRMLDAPHLKSARRILDFLEN